MRLTAPRIDRLTPGQAADAPNRPSGSLACGLEGSEVLANVCSNNDNMVHDTEFRPDLVQQLIQLGARCVVSLVYEGIVQEAYHSYGKYECDS
jgi:hypothetical protein